MHSYVVDPIRVFVYDPRTAAGLKIYLFVADAPRAIHRAIDRNDKDALRAFYGPKFAKKLSLDMQKTGAADSFENLDDLESLLAGKDEKAQSTKRVEYVTTVSLYPEDNFAELKRKIQIASGVPTYRQHIFYLEGDSAVTTYNIRADGPYETDIRQASVDFMFGAPIDKTLYNARTDLRVEALDTLWLLQDKLPPSSTVYLVDLAEYTRRVPAQMSEMAADKYQFELYYYGFVLKYWPSLTPECFLDYITAEDKMTQKYPDLALSTAQITLLYEGEQALLRECYKLYPKTATWVPTNMSAAITGLTASTRGGAVGRLNMRNLFDSFRVSATVPEVNVHLDGTAGRLLLTKRYELSQETIRFPTGAISKKGFTAAITMTEKSERPTFVFLTLHEDSTYYIRLESAEERERMFDDILRLAKRFVQPVLDAINALGRMVLAAGQPLSPITASNIQYKSLQICLFWKKTFSDDAFKTLKRLWEEYYRTALASARPAQSTAGTMEIMFHKGVHQHDSATIEKILSAASGTTLYNQYGHLSSALLRQKWNQHFDGRIIRMTHRTTDVCFELVNVREREFAIIRRYIETFTLRASEHANIKNAVVHAKDAKKLRKMREYDPVLFNMKRHGSDRIYSILCQNHRQPMVYTAEEVKKLPRAEMERLVKYWNFTLSKNAYYGCPNSAYPHLSFIVNVHPKHYCLPCCRKSEASEGSKKARVNTICLRDHKYNIVDESAILHHVINYGKDIEPGRLSNIPGGPFSKLFTALSEPPLAYYLYGMDNAAYAAGTSIVPAIAESLTLAVPDMVMEWIKFIKNSAENFFYSLAGGHVAEYFGDSANFVHVLYELFVLARPFVPMAAEYYSWRDTVTELAFAVQGACAVIFYDKTGRGADIQAYVPTWTRRELGRPGSVASYLLLFKKESDYYPIFCVDSGVFFKTMHVEVRIFGPESSTADMLRDFALSSSPARKDHSAGAVYAFASGAEGYTVKKQFINKRVYCYALLLECSAGAAYVAVPECAAIENVPVEFNAFDRPAAGGPVAALRQFASDYGRITFDQWLKYDELIIGAIDTEGLVYYFSDSAVDGAMKSIVHVKYDYSVINGRILGRDPVREDRRSTHLGSSLYEKYQYRLFVAEFANYLRGERHEKLRSEIISEYGRTNFLKSALSFRSYLTKTLSDYPTDLATIRLQAAECASSGRNFAQLLGATTYEFDKKTIRELRASTAESAREKLRALCAEFAVQKPMAVENITFPNIYTSCADSDHSASYCDGSKLIVENMDQLVETLAANIRDDLKFRYLVETVNNMDNVIDRWKFEKRQGERIRVYQLD